MEKFGIFELLDALSALTAQNGPEGAFDPPAYGEKPPQKTGGRENDALAGFLARHDAVARKAEKK